MRTEPVGNGIEPKVAQFLGAVAAGNVVRSEICRCYRNQLIGLVHKSRRSRHHDIAARSAHPGRRPPQLRADFAIGEGLTGDEIASPVIGSRRYRVVRRDGEGTCVDPGASRAAPHRRLARGSTVEDRLQRRLQLGRIARQEIVVRHARHLAVPFLASRHAILGGVPQRALQLIGLAASQAVAQDNGTCPFCRRSRGGRQHRTVLVAGPQYQSLHVVGRVRTHDRVAGEHRVAGIGREILNADQHLIAAHGIAYSIVAALRTAGAPADVAEIRVVAVVAGSAHAVAEHGDHVVVVVIAPQRVFPYQRETASLAVCAISSSIDEIRRDRRLFGADTNRAEEATAPAIAGDFCRTGIVGLAQWGQGDLAVAHRNLELGQALSHGHGIGGRSELVGIRLVLHARTKVGLGRGL